MANSYTIAKMGNLALVSEGGKQGYVVNTETGQKFEPHSIVSILAKGDWVLEPNLDEMFGIVSKEPLSAEDAARRAAGL